MFRRGMSLFSGLRIIFFFSLKTRFTVASSSKSTTAISPLSDLLLRPYYHIISIEYSRVDHALPVAFKQKES